MTISLCGHGHEVIEELGDVISTSELSIEMTYVHPSLRLSKFGSL